MIGFSSNYIKQASQVCFFPQGRGGTVDVVLAPSMKSVSVLPTHKNTYKKSNS